MPSPIAAACVAALVLALVHALTPAMRFLGGTPRSAWLSIAGGVSVAYVFVHLLPELAAGQADISRAVTNVEMHFAERHVYLIALAGLAVFYGLDKLAKHSRGEAEPGSEGSTGPGVFWIHMASFGIYNSLIGYLLLHREAPGLRSLAFFAAAMALHFLVTDFGLDEDHKSRYRRIGRWVLIAAVVAGVAAGAATEIPKAALAVLVAFLAGGVILNVLKEEVPNERRSRFWAFALGMAGYAVLLLAL
jgi:hypothetical protein